jgi:putative acetyltransferase
MPTDRPTVEAIYPQAFPDEDLVPLLHDLWRDPGSILSLVAVSDNELVAHAVFTRCSLAPKPAPVALLGPVAVHPDRQGLGIGGALIRHGLERLAGEGMAAVCVLGDPAYYSRFEFEAPHGIEPPYSPPVPPREWQGAWRCIALDERGKNLNGRLVVPAAWDHESLWLP